MTRPINRMRASARLRALSHADLVWLLVEVESLLNVAHDTDANACADINRPLRQAKDEMLDYSEDKHHPGSYPDRCEDW